MKKQFLFATLFLCGFLSSFSQILLQESFDGTTFAPAGWYNTRILPSVSTTTGIWDRATSNSFPVISPRTGAAMARFNSNNLPSNTEAELGTPVINLSSGLRHRLRFWIYRQDVNSGFEDRLDTYINTQQNITGAVKLTTVFASRLKPTAEAANGWYQVLVDIPASFNTSTNYIIFRAVGKGVNPICIDDVSVEVTSCFAPSSPSVSNITQTAATLNWSAPATGTPAGYEWEVRTLGTPGTGAAGFIASGTVASNASSVNIGSLQQGTTYSFYVRTTCGGENSTWTDAVNFTTTCNLFTLPYTENFDGITSGIPPCAAVENVNAGYAWSGILPNYTSSYANSGNNGLISLNGAPFGSSTTGPQNDWFFTPGFALQAGKCYRFSYAYRVGNSLAPQAMEVRVNSSQTANTGTILSTNNSVSHDTYIIKQETFTVGADGTYYISFYHKGGTNGGFLLIDDISLQETIGSPVNIVPSAITTSTATVSWQASLCGTPTGYDWELRTSGAAGSGATGLITSGSANVVTTNFSSLNEGTTYSFYVRAKAGTLNSVWSVAATFQTQCSIRTLPYSENFDGVTAPSKPFCVFTDNPSGGNPWVNVSNSLPKSAPNCMRIQYNSPTGTSLDGWFFTPSFNFTAGKSYRLTFWYRAHIVYSTEKLEVKYGQGATAAAMTSTTLFFNNGFNTAFWQQYTVDFVPASTGVYNIGFHAFSGPNGNDFIRVDDITVTETPVCDSVRSVKAVNITTSNATINWSLPVSGTPSDYSWELRTSGAAGSGTTGLLSSGTAASGATSQTVNGLSASVNYQFYIRSNCGASTGDWVQYNFSSACNAATIPYAENFDGVSAPQFPLCIREEDKADDAKWITLNNTFNARSTPNSMWHNFNPWSPVDDWFFTAPLQLQAGKLYRIAFYYKAESATYSEALEIKIATFAQVSATTGSPIYSATNLKSTTYQQQFVDFLVPADGVYYLGFHSFSSYSQGGIYIDDISVVETITTSVRELRNNPDALVKQVYPNPVKDKLIVSVNTDKDFGRMNAIVRDNSGRVIKRFTLQLNGSVNYTIDMKGLANGIYIIETEHEKTGTRSMSKVVKQ